MREFAAGRRTRQVDAAAHVRILKNALAVDDQRLEIISRIRILVVDADVFEPGFSDLEVFVFLEDIGDLEKTDAHAMAAAAAVRADLAMPEVGWGEFFHGLLSVQDINYNAEGLKNNKDPQGLFAGRTDIS
jgi:hypothetical protein